MSVNSETEIKKIWLHPQVETCQGCSTNATEGKYCACKTVKYCCKEHQISCWNAHQQMCRRARRMLKDNETTGTTEFLYLLPNGNVNEGISLTKDFYPAAILGVEFTDHKSIRDLDNYNGYKLMIFCDDDMLMHGKSENKLASVISGSLCYDTILLVDDNKKLRKHHLTDIIRSLYEKRNTACDFDNLIKK